MKLSENTLTYRDENSFLLVIGIPVPISNEYHDISNISFNTGEIIELNEDGDIYLRIESSCPVDEIVLEYDMTCYDAKADFSKINRIFPYSSEFERFTEYEGPLIDPDNTQIQRIADGLRESSADILEYARQAYQVLQDMLIWTDQRPYEDLDDIFNNGGGDCGGLSSVYISLLRNNGIPARYMTGGIILPDGTFGHHVWTEFYLENYGWIPADPSVFANTDPFFGYISNDYIFFNRGGNFDFDSGNDIRKIWILQDYAVFNLYFDSSVSGTYNYDWVIIPEVIYETDRSTYYNSTEYVSGKISELIRNINSARIEDNLTALHESEGLNEIALEILNAKMYGTAEPDFFAECDKKGIGIYWYNMYWWAFTVFDLEVSNQIVDLCGNTVLNERFNTIGIGYIYSAEHGNQYFMIFAGL